MPKSFKVVRVPKAQKNNSLVKSSKALSKAIDKKTKKINKAIDKKINQIKKEHKKRLKKKEGILAKRERQINRLAERALQINKETQALVNEFKRDFVSIDNEDLLYLTKQRIQDIQAKKRPTEKDVEKLKDYAKVSHYDYIKLGLDIRTGTDDDDVQVPEAKEVSLKQIKQILRKQVNFPERITEEEQQIIANYAKSMINYQNTMVEDLDTAEQQEQFKKRFKKTRDVAIGGNSTLINDLSYTYDCLNAGRDFVIKLQQVMSNPSDFVMIEAWYRGTQEGKDVQNEIDQAVGARWYDMFKSFRVTINTAINSFPNLSKKAEQLLSDYQNQIEVEADEEVI